MSDLPEFTLRVDQNPFLPAGGREMHAIVTVRARGSAVPERPNRTLAAEVIVIDTSGSMSYGGKLTAAKRAARAAVAQLRDGVHFAIVSGANGPAPVYPASGLAVADERTRRAATRAIARLEAAGGTAIGSWLLLAERLLSARRDAVRHVILLTDGKNQHETPEELDRALRRCAGTFVCDARGVGTDWEVAELRTITEALLGGFLDIPDPEDLKDDFIAMTRASMGKQIADVALRLWTPQRSHVRFLKQITPHLTDLTGKRVGSGRQTADYPLGAWGAEEREYHLCVEVEPGGIGRQMRVAGVKLIGPAERVLASGRVVAEWTDDEGKTTRINHRVAYHTGQSELADAIQEGLEARRAGDEDAATARLGRAVVLAGQVGNTQIKDLLGNVVDVLDPEHGTVRLKRTVSKADEMALNTRSQRTVRTRSRDDDPARSTLQGGRGHHDLDPFS